MFRLIGMALIVLLLNACAAASPAEGTLTMQNATLGTQMAYVRQTATFAGDLNNRTLEYLGTAQAGAEVRQSNLISTMQVLNIPVDPSIVTPAAPGVSIQNQSPPPVNNTNNAVVMSAAETPIPQPVTIDSSGPNVTNLVTSTGVDNNDCALGITTAFTSMTPEIYAVATANNFPIGMSATFSWIRDGTSIYSDTFTWDFEINGACIWYYVTPQDFEFLAGTYTVQIESGGVPIGNPAVFTITEG